MKVPVDALSGKDHGSSRFSLCPPMEEGQGSSLGCHLQGYGPNSEGSDS